MKSILITISIIISLNVFSAHHESNESGLVPVAKPGQVIVTYRGQCAEKNINKAISMVKKIIAYEIKNSPISYSSSPGAWSDGTIGAVDLHDSLEAMEKAFAWQAAAQNWSSMYEDVAKACGITIEDFEVLNLVAR